MIGYKIYLTKSKEVAELLSKGCVAKMAHAEETDGRKITSVHQGYVTDNEHIPAIYHNDGWFYTAEYYGNLDHPMYEIVFA